jgi:hypothetical protein
MAFHDSLLTPSSSFGFVPFRVAPPNSSALDGIEFEECEYINIASAFCKGCA